METRDFHADLAARQPEFETIAKCDIGGATHDLSVGLSANKRVATSQNRERAERIQPRHRRR